MLPGPEAVAKLLEEILGQPVAARKRPPNLLTGPGTRLVAVFESDDDTIVAVCVCDLTLAVEIGAVLVMLPPATVHEAILEGKCSPNLLENLAEVLNICRPWFQKSAAHVRSPRLYQTPCDIPAPVSKLLIKPRQRLDLDVTISGYRSGKMTMVE
jgi:hypothetical protein